jgi:hypothetical protein
MTPCRSRQGLCQTLVDKYRLLFAATDWQEQAQAQRRQGLDKREQVLEMYCQAN